MCLVVEGLQEEHLAAAVLGIQDQEHDQVQVE
jgi:hypothetical protein